MERLGELVARGGPAREGPGALTIDGLIGVGAATPDLADRIAAAGPYGAAAPAPRVALAGVRVAGARKVGVSHLALSLADTTGARVEAVAFRAFEGPLGPWLAQAQGATVHLAGRFERDDWGGRPRAKLHVEDAASAG
jgi:single-stranded-DNA-specific exonuclease